MNNDLMFSSATTEWTTPPELFEALNKKHHFTLDAAATAENALCEKYYTEETDGMSQPWYNESVFLNPPFGSGERACKKKIDPDTGQRVYNCEKKICKKRGYHIDKDIPSTGDWIKKAWEESLRCTAVLLIPARTDTAAWHECIFNESGDGFQDGVKCMFLPGRLKYGNASGTTDPAPFPSAVVEFDRRHLLLDIRDYVIDIDKVMKK